MLAIAVVFEAIVLVIALRAFVKIKGTRSVWEEIRTTKDPATFVVLFEDTAAITGLIVAFAGIYLGHRFDNPYFDGGASLVIGVILMGVAGFLGFESKGLLIGEGAGAETLDSIRALAEADPNVKEVRNLLTMYFGPQTVLLTLEIAFAAGVSASERTSAVAHLERRIRGRHPAIKHVFIEARSLETSLPS